MKQFILVLFLSVLSVCTFAQDRITINDKNITRIEAFQAIEKQTGYSIAYEQSGLDLKKKLNLLLREVTLNEAIKAILYGTNLTYKINGYHIIIVSVDTNTLERSEIIDNFFIEETNNRSEYFIYEGLVLDSIANTPLGYATIVLLDGDKKQLSVGISNNNGQFRIGSSYMAESIRISFIGYKTKIVKSTNTNIGSVLLAPDEKVLSEMLVMGITTEHLVDRNSYLVTDQMRQKASNAQELLDQIHGVRFDKLSNSIRVGNETSVLLLVDGMKQSDLYIKNLPPNRIHRIKVVTEPSGRYLTEGYAAIVNFILEKDYEGYDINARNFMMLSLGNNNDKDHLRNDQPGIGFTYTKDKINVFANYTYARIRMNTPVWKSETLSDLLEKYPVKEDQNDANNRYRYRANTVGGGINYQLNPDHSISFQGDYSYQNTNEETQLNYNILYPKTNTWDKENTVREDGTRDKDYVGTAFYKGKIGQRLNIYSDFTYNYYSNDVTNFYQDSESSISINTYKENKNYTKFNLEGEYIFSPKFSLNIGYVNVWRKYESKDNYSNTTFLHYNEWRNQLFTYLQYRPSDKLVVKVGANVEYIRTYSETKNNDWSILPYFQMNYKANQNINLNLSYLTNITYPTLYQLSPITTYINSFTRQSGNPELRSAVGHSISAKLTLWDRLTIRPMFRYTPKHISEVYTSGMLTDAVFSTFENIDAKQYAIQAIYDQPLGNYFKLSNTLTYYYNKANNADFSNSYQGFMLDSEIEYFNPKWNMGVQIGYYRDIDKKAMLQGYQMVDLDSWLITMNKQFWNKQASLMISYFPPITWGIRSDLRKEIETPFYSEKYVQNLKPYRNMLMIRFSLRFNSGNVKSIIKQSSTEREERARRAVDF